MDPDDDEHTLVIRTIVLRAAEGHQYEALSELLELTGSEVPQLAWLAAAAALPGMHWEDASGEASVMVQRIVERFGAVAEREELSAFVHFDEAVAAGALYGDEDGVPRLLEMAGQLPPTHGLHHRLLWVAGHMAEHGPAACMPLCLTEPEELWPREAGLLEKGPGALTPADVRRLWQHATAKSRPDVLLELHAAGLEMPDQVPVWWALAESLGRDGRADEAEQVLLDARPLWYPLSVWETLPVTPVLNPGLRPLLTDRVREAYYTLPVGERAR